MHRRFLQPILVGIITALFAFPSTSHAETMHVSRVAGSAYDLIDAVNALRASNGLPPYSISSILMSTAQSQADFMAATGTVTHSGPGGINVTDRLLAAGYPLAGDLSLGGFRSENIISGTEDMPAEEAIRRWTGDAPHLTTMLSPDLTEIGAGATVANGRVYYVIDAARPTTGGVSSAVTPLVGGGSAVPAMETPVFTLVLSTPNADGDIIHEVLPGQTLWRIAISYDVKIDDIKRLNNLLDDNIYPGEKLLIRKAESTPTATLTEVPTMTSTALPSATASPVPSSTETQHPPPVQTIIPEARTANNNMIISIVIGIIALALLGGAFAWSGSDGKTQ